MEKQSFSFADLSPDVLLDALDSIEVHAESGLLALNSYENRVYQFKAEDGQRYVTKFYRPARWSDQQIDEEHQFTLELEQHDIPVAAPIAINGSTLHHYNGYRFALFPSVGGRQFEVDNFDQLEWVGRFLGRIHQVGQRQPFIHRPTLGLEEYVYQPRQILANSDFIPDYLKHSFFADLDRLITEIESHWSTDWPALRLHGDCHPGNILWRDGPMFVDLDDARNGPAVQDLWMMLNGERHDQLAQLDTLLEAYNEFADFDPRQLKLIEPLRALRMVHYMAWLAKRWQDPAFPRAFPWFGDAKYWEGQVLAFKEQIFSLNEQPLQLMPQW
ncbi:serine/threonine protein kinase [Photobacterium aquimaris]|uniref:Stress response kinase A n=1 Tax=Photobacterium aquimaris TaxID=512643 RepID=A0A2T3HXT0_9GAMM|nr:serine/threonine protein kinase [Photobacterium aquimaris]OBU23036.1 stress response serine/threonine protein kinase YihE [Photobacterium aquimaris]PQJ37331.1 stress response serine/threonine protein kinase YihE [Photobacterium aquimaris]PSU04199.1 serine/threonine protein kinase [Photobacterium aquimaris]